MTDDLVKRLRGIDRTDIYLYETMNDAADRIEELEAKLATCEKYRDAYAECDRIGTQVVRDLEAKLAKAVRTMREAVMAWEQPHYGNMDTALDHGSEAIDLLRATLAEIDKLVDTVNL